MAASLAYPVNWLSFQLSEQDLRTFSSGSNSGFSCNENGKICRFSASTTAQVIRFYFDATIKRRTKLPRLIHISTANSKETTVLLFVFPPTLLVSNCGLHYPS
jgi:hypothetical protein